jgi:hypothetical protein
MTPEDNQKIAEELEQLKDSLKEMEENEKLKSEAALIRKKIKQLTFRQKHPKLLKVTETIGKTTTGFFKGLFTGIPKAFKAVGRGLEKSDAYIAKQQAAESASKQSTTKPKKDTSIKDALGLID